MAVKSSRNINSNDSINTAQNDKVKFSASFVAHDNKFLNSTPSSKSYDDNTVSNQALVNEYVSGLKTFFSQAKEFLLPKQTTTEGNDRATHEMSESSLINNLDESHLKLRTEDSEFIDVSKMDIIDSSFGGFYNTLYKYTANEIFANFDVSDLTHYDYSTNLSDYSNAWIRNAVGVGALSNNSSGLFSLDVTSSNSSENNAFIDLPSVSIMGVNPGINAGLVTPLNVFFVSNQITTFGLSLFSIANESTSTIVSTSTPSNVSSPPLPSPPNHAPVANEDIAFTTQEESVLIDILSNDTDPDPNDAFTLMGVQKATEAKGTVTIVNSKISYDPGIEYNYLADGEYVIVTIYYSITDIMGVTSSSTVNVIVMGLNNIPLSGGDNLDGGSATQDEAAILGVAPTASDVDVGDTLSYVLVDGTIAGNTLNSLDGSTIVFSQGTLTLNADGSYSFSLNPNEFSYLALGSFEEITFHYHAIDNHGAVSSDSTIKLTVSGLNDTPVSGGDNLNGGSATQNETTILGIAPTANDVDVGDILSYVLVDGTIAGNTLNSLDGSTIVFSQGTLTLNADGSYSFSLNPNEFSYLALGSFEEITFHYHAIDNHGAVSSDSTIKLTVTGLNDAPNSGGDNLNGGSATQNEAAILGVAPLASDIDVGDILSYVLVDGTIAGNTLNSLDGSTILFSQGTITLNADGSYSFSLNPNEFYYLALGSFEEITFHYHAIDNHGAVSSDSTIKLTVSGLNDAPESGGDNLNGGSATQDEATILGIAPTASDVDVGDILSYVLVDGTIAGSTLNSLDGSTIVFSQGTLTLNADGSYSFSLNPNEFSYLALGSFEEITFHYHAMDNHGTVSSDSTIKLTVSGLNDAPESGGDGFNSGIETDLTVIGSLPIGSDVDLGASIQYHLIGGSDDTMGNELLSIGGGLISLNKTTGEYSFTIDLSYFQHLAQGGFEIVNFSYNIIDNLSATSATHIVAITINGVNTDPVNSAPIPLQTATPLTQTEISLGQFFTDVDDGDTFTYQIFELINSSLVPVSFASIIGNQLILTPSTNDNGIHTLVIRATDPYNGSIDASFTFYAVSPSFNQTDAISSNIVSNSETDYDQFTLLGSIINNLPGGTINTPLIYIDPSSTEILGQLQLTALSTFSNEVARINIGPDPSSEYLNNQLYFGEGSESLAILVIMNDGKIYISNNTAFDYLSISDFIKLNIEFSYQYNGITYTTTAHLTINGEDNNDVFLATGGLVDAGIGDDIIYVDDAATAIQVEGGAGYNALDYRNISIPTFNIDFNQGIAYRGSLIDTFTNISQWTGSLGNDAVIAPEGFNLKLDGYFGDNSLDYIHKTGGVVVDVINGTVVTPSGTDYITNFNIILATDFIDHFILNNESYVLTGRMGVNSVDYSNLTSSVTLSHGLDNIIEVTKNGTLDILNQFNVLTLTSFDDTVYGNSNLNHSYFAGDGLDTLNYINADTSGIQIDILSGQVIKPFGTDTTSGFETFIGTHFDDFFAMTTSGGYTIDGLDAVGQDIADYSSMTFLSGISVVFNSSNHTSVTSSLGTDNLYNIENIIIQGTDFDDIFDYANKVGDSTFLATAGSDEYIGSNGVNTMDYSASTSGLTFSFVGVTGQVVKNNGTDSINNFDQLIGSDHADTFNIDDTGSLILIGNGGLDSVDYTYLSTTTDIIVQTNAVDNSFIVQKWGGQDQLHEIEHIVGTLGNNQIFQTLSGTYTFERFNTVSYEDYSQAILIEGVNQDLTVNKGNGIDTLIGTSNIVATEFDDTYISAGKALTFAGNLGYDTIDYSQLSVSIIYNDFNIIHQGGTDNIDSIENLIATDYDDSFDVAKNIDIDAGSGFDEINYSTSFDYPDIVSKIVFDPNTLKYVVSKGSSTASLKNIEKISGGSFYELVSLGSLIMHGVTTVDYSGADTAIVANLDTGIITKALGTDTVNNLNSSWTLIGTDYSDTFQSSNYSGPETITWEIYGGLGNDNMDYSLLTQGINVQFDGSTITVEKGDPSKIDILHDIENINGTPFDDQFHGDPNADAGYYFISTAGNDLYDGGNNVNGTTIDYSGQVGNIVVNAFDKTITKLNGTDSFDQIQKIMGTSGNDVFYANPVFDQFGIEYRGNGGDDTVDFSLSENTNIHYDNVLGAFVQQVGFFGNTDKYYDISHFIGSNFDDYFDIAFDVGRNLDIYSGAGDDIFNITVLNSTHSLSLFGEGNDDLFSINSDVNIGLSLSGGTGNNTLDYGMGSTAVNIDLINGQVFRGSVVDTITDMQNFIGTSANDTFKGIGVGNYSFEHIGGDDRIDYSGLSNGITLNVGMSTAYSIVKSGGTDSITGFHEFIGTHFNDSISLVSAFGTERIFVATKGNDTYYVSNFNGINIIDYSQMNSAGIVIDFSANEFTISVNKGSGTDTLTNETNVDFNEFIATAGNDTVYADAGNYIFYGLEGINVASYEGAIGYNVTFTATGSGLTANALGNINQFISFLHATGSELNDSFIANNVGNYVFVGGLGLDTVDYSLTNGISATSNGVGVYTVVKSGGTDNLIDQEQILGSDHNDTFVWDDADNSVIATLGSDFHEGGMGINSIIYSNLSNALNVLVIDDTHITVSKSGNGTDSVINFVELVGGSGNDTFVSNDSGNFTFNGGDGLNTLNYGSLTSGITIDMGNTSISKGVSANTDNFENFHIIMGSLFQDHFIGVDAGSITFTGNGGADSATYDTVVSNLTATVSGNQVSIVKDLGTDTFNEVYSYTMSINNDTFNVGDNNNYTIDALDGVDTLNYGLASGAVTLDIASGNVSKNGDSFTDTFYNFEIFEGSTHNDIFIGASDGFYTLTGNGGSDTVDYTALSANILYTLDSTVSVNKFFGIDTLNSIRTLISGSGQDGFVVNATANGNYILDGSVGTDFVDYSAYNGISVLSNGINAYTVTRTNGADSLLNIETLIATSGNDNFVGDSNNDTFLGTLGSDTYNGNLGVNLVKYTSLSNNLTITVDPTHITVAKSSNGTDTLTNISQVISGGGNDVFLGTDAGNYTFNGDFNIDTLNYNLASNAVTINIASGIVTKNGGLNSDAFSNFETFVGSSLADTFIGRSDGFYTLTGNGGVDIANYSAFSSGLVVTLNPSNTTIGKPLGTDTLNAINSIVLGSGNDNVMFASGTLGSFTLNGNGGTDTLHYGSLSGPITVNLSTGIVTKPSSTQDTISNFENIFGTAQADSFIGTHTGNYTLNGNGGADTISYASSSSNFTFNINPTNVVVTKSAGTDTLTGFTNNLTLGSGNDTIIFSSGAIASYTFNAGGGSDTLDYSATIGPITVDINGAKVTRAGGIIDNTPGATIETYIGTASDDIFISSGGGLFTFIGNGGNNSLQYFTANTIHATINASNITVIKGAASIVADTIYDVRNILTGIGNDDITFTAGATGNYILNGNTGTADFVDYSALSNAVTVDLTLGTVVRSNGTDMISNLEGFVGTGQNDTFKATTAGSYTFNGGNGTDIVNYSAANGINVTHNIGNYTVVKTGGGTDTLLNIEQILGTSVNDTFTDSNGLADSYIASLGTDTYTDSVGAANSIDYSALSNALTVTVNNATTASIAKSGSGTDSLTNVFSIVGGSGNDTFNSLSGPSYTFVGGSGTDTLNYLAVTGGGLLMNLHTGAVTKPSGSDTVSGFEIVNGSNQDDNIYGAALGNYTIDGKLGSNMINYTSLSEGITVTGTGGVNTVTKSVGNVDVVSNFSIFAGSTKSDNMTISIVGNALVYGTLGSDTIHIIDATFKHINYNFSGDTSIAIDTTTIGATGHVAIYKSSGTDFILNNFDMNKYTGTAGNDIVYVANVVNNLTVDGAGGSNTIDYHLTNLGLTITATASGTNISVVNSIANTNTNLFQNMFNLIGTVNNDTFISDSGQSYNFDGYTGSSDTISYNVAAFASGVTITNTGTGNFTITKPIGLDTVSRVERILGGSGNDTFRSINNSGSTYTFDAGLGTDTLDYSLYSNGIILTLSSATAGSTQLGVGSIDSFSNFEKYTGSSGSDTFIPVLASSATFDGGAGTELDTLSYQSLSSPISGTITANVLSSIVKSGGGTDSVIRVENYLGSSGNDTITFTNIANNTVFGSNGTDSYSANTGTHTIDYSSFVSGNAIAFHYTGGPITVTKSGSFSGTDTLSGFTSVVGTINQDTFSVGASLGNYTLHGGSGTDVLWISNNMNDSIIIDPSNNIITVNGSTWVHMTGMESFALSNDGNTLYKGILSGSTTFLNESTGINAVDYSMLNTSVTFNSVSNDTFSVIKAGSGTDTISANYITGSQGNDTLNINFYNDSVAPVVHSSAGNDSLSSGIFMEYVYDKIVSAITATYSSTVLSDGKNTVLVDKGIHGTDSLVSTTLNSAPFVIGSAGNDIFIDYTLITSNFGQHLNMYDGSGGYNQLFINRDLDLSSGVNNNIFGMQMINLGTNAPSPTANILSLTAASAESIGKSNPLLPTGVNPALHQLVIQGSSIQGDIVNLSGAHGGFSLVGTTVNPYTTDGFTYDHYQAINTIDSATVDVYIQQGVNVNLI